MNFTRELPEGYHLVREIDAVGDKKFAIWMNVAAAALSVVVFLLADWLRFGRIALRYFLPAETGSLWAAEAPVLAFLAAMIAYLILHELTHGIVYKRMTGEKLTFGLTLSCAYCGVPHIYVTRRTALCALLAPFAVFTVVLGVLIALLPDCWAIYACALFALHFGGCAGDLYDTALLLTSLRGDILMRDTGPKQSFYRRDEI